jgi:hypothetical protein
MKANTVKVTDIPNVDNGIALMGVPQMAAKGKIPRMHRWTVGIAHH